MSPKPKKQPATTSNGKPAKPLPRKKPSAKAPAPTPAASAARTTKAAAAPSPTRTTGKVVARYIYTDETGKILFRVNRTDDKKFYQQHLDAAGTWVNGLANVRRVLYRLEALCCNPDAPVVVVEGEKDADTMARLGFASTTSPMGAGKWNADYSESLRGREVYLFPDNDDPGRKHMDGVRAALKGIAKRVVIVSIPTAGVKDVSDLYAGGADRTVFLEMMRTAELKTPADSDPAPGVLADASSSTKPPSENQGDRQARETRSADWALLYDVVRVEQKWLWKERIPSDTFTLLYGAPGVGKSFLTIDIAARVTRGRDFPDGCKGGDPGDVILLTGEDRIETTVKSRMQSAGGDETRVAVVRGTSIIEKDGTRTLDPFALQDIRPLIEVADQLKNPKLVVIDPISVFSGGIDDHKNQEVRRMLGGLRTFCEAREIAAIIVTHPNKGTGPALNRIAGSIALGAAVRSAWCVCHDDEDPSGKNRLLLCAKPNLCEDPSGLSYKIIRSQEAGAAATVSWGEHPVMRTANEAMMDDQANGNEAREERRKAKRNSENEGRLLRSIEQLPKDTEGYVAVVDVEEITGMHHEAISKAIVSLEESGDVHVKWNPVELSRGGSKARGRRMVRRIPPAEKVF